MWLDRFQEDYRQLTQGLGLSNNPEQWVTALSPFLQDSRKSAIDALLKRRNLRILPVLDQIYDAGNINAALRSLEGLGYAAVDLIQTQTQFRSANRFSAGADKWLSIRRWKTPDECLQQLRADGFSIVATDLQSTTPIQQWDWSLKTAVILGNEHQGVSKTILNQADARICLPMQGFTQSFNISVATALIMREIQHAFPPDFLTRNAEEEKIISSLRLIYYLKSLQQPRAFLSGLLKRSMLQSNHGQFTASGISGTPPLP